MWELLGNISKILSISQILFFFFFRILCPLWLKRNVENLSRVQNMATIYRGALGNRTH